MSEDSHNPFEFGPYIQIAAFCEYVLQEPDGVTTLVRVVDRVTHTYAGVNAPEAMPEFNHPLWLVIALKPGSARGRHSLAITPAKPSGESLHPIRLPIHLEGENRGVSVVTRLDIRYQTEGLYWFDVAFDGIRITRLPLEVMYSNLDIQGPVV